MRYTNYEQNGYTLTGATSSHYSQSGVLTPSVALMRASKRARMCGSAQAGRSAAI
ncbi:hypothetical protein V4C53_05635 [Paraburkholderia azotifigens]|uniref:hypothetical protein n=1 Tax=Paraburkholderia azotifigens TaxID=2057004 RepID=UPI0004B65634